MNKDFKQQGKQRIIESLIQAISEDLLLKVLEKEVVRQDDIFCRIPKTFKDESTFYLSIFYKNAQIRSRTVSNCAKDNNRFSKTESPMHQKLYDLHLCHMKPDSVAVESGFINTEKPYMLIRIGNLVAIVSNSNQILTEIFSFIFATFFTTLKATFEISESGQLVDLEKAATNYSYGLNYIKRVQDSLFGKYRGHM